MQVTEAVGNDEHHDVVPHHPIDEAIGLEEHLTVVLDSEIEQLSRALARSWRIEPVFGTLNRGQHTHRGETPCVYWGATAKKNGLHRQAIGDGAGERN